MRRPRFVRMGLLACVVSGSLTACASNGTGADAGGPAEGQVPSGPRVPLVADVLFDEACALPDMPVATAAQRAEFKRLSTDLVMRHDGTRSRRGERDYVFLLVQFPTLADLRPGETFFGSPHPRPTLVDGSPIATTLEEGMQMLAEACSAAG